VEAAWGAVGVRPCPRGAHRCGVDEGEEQDEEQQPRQHQRDAAPVLPPDAVAQAAQRGLHPQEGPLGTPAGTPSSGPGPPLYPPAPQGDASLAPGLTRAAGAWGLCWDPPGLSPPAALPPPSPSAAPGSAPACPGKVGGQWGTGSVPTPPPSLSSLSPSFPDPPIHREAPLAVLLHRAGPPPPRPFLSEKGEPGGHPGPPPAPGALGGPLRHWGAVLGALGRLQQLVELQLQDPCRGKSRGGQLPVTRGCSPPPMGAPHHARGGGVGKQGGGLTQKIIGRELVVVPHLEDELGGHLQHRLVQAPEMLLVGGKRGVTLVPCPPPRPGTPTPGCPSPCAAGCRAARPPGTRRRR